MLLTPDVNLNHGRFKHCGEEGETLTAGSYGTPPRPVIEAMHKLSDEIEANPDFFMRRTYFGLLDSLREDLAKMIGATTPEVVLVPNTTHGICNIVTQLKWSPGDVIVICEYSHS